MRKDLITSLLAIVVLTVLLGLAYPLATTGVAQVVFPGKSDGSQIERDGKDRGLAADRPGLQGPGPATSSRAPRSPATTPPTPTSTTSGRTTQELAEQFKQEPGGLPTPRARYGAVDPGDVPADAVQTTASGVDPHISAGQRPDPGPPRGRAARPVARRACRS